MRGSLTLRTTGPDGTRAVGAALASLARPGDVVALSGELGAGKTCLVQGAAAALGVADRVTSPTFVLVKQYPTARLPVVHCDVYRLDRLADVLDLGDEVMAPDVLTFIEWGDAVTALLPDDRLEVELLLAGAPDEGSDPAPLEGKGTGVAGPGGELAEVAGERRLRVSARGTWEPRLAELAESCRAWLADGSSTSEER